MLTETRSSDGVISWVVFLGSLVCYHTIYSHFFPTPDGLIGHDYALGLPALYDGLLWHTNNPVLSVPWFTPSFCGGQPFFADPQSAYYSVVQWLYFLFKPLDAIYLSLLAFASLSFWGLYLFCRNVFSMSAWTAALAGFLFMFNTFLAHRWIVGHLGFQGFALVPWIALVLAMDRELAIGPLRRGGNVIIAGVLIAYWLQSAMGSIMVPAALSVYVLAACRGVAGDSLVPFFVRSGLAGIVALSLSSSKLVASAAFMSGFPRDDYRLPGFNSVAASLEMALRSLASSSTSVHLRSQEVIENIQWSLHPHEWSYSVTPVPFVLIVVGAAMWLYQNRGVKPEPSPARAHWRRFSIASLVVVAMLPVALNVYTPDWNAFLKQVPIIRSNSSLVRWYIIYIPIVVFGAALLVDRVSLARVRQHVVVPVVMVVTLVLHAFEDRSYYFGRGTTFDPTATTVAWARVKSTGAVPPITAIAEEADGVTGSLFQNELIVAGLSQAMCYNPVFGYRLEHLPVKTMMIAPVFTEHRGVFNMKNPACYVYPAENGCEPGDHFEISARSKLETFTHYRPIPFERSGLQRAADVLTLSCLAAVAALAVFAGAWSFYSRLEIRRPT